MHPRSLLAVPIAAGVLIAGTACGAGAAAAAIRLVPHVTTRIEIWKNPWATVT